MKQVILLSMGWALAVAGFYAALVALEFYWNLYTWNPRYDWPGFGLILGIVALLGVIGWLARVTRDGISRGVSLAICVGLVAIGIYVFPREPLHEGLFGRTASSPVWYRAGRLMLLSVPAVCWVRAVRTWRKR